MAKSQAEIREWAKSRGMKVGTRGRLHPDIIAAYLSEFPGSAVESHQDRIARMEKNRKYTRVRETLTPEERVDELEMSLRANGTHISQQAGWMD